MTQTCSKCSRINPADASYCYFDGAALDSSRVNGGPIRSGTKAFAHPFVFPSGRVCGNFDQLALACHEVPGEAMALLREGFLAKFLGNLGRADLATAATEAACFPDQERALDQFLTKLPTDVIQDPALGIEATEFNLGRLQVGENRTLQLRLFNQGMRLVYGTISCDNCVWLAVGEAPGAPQKVFRFSDELIIPIQVRGKYLQANRKPLEGRLSIDSNGGGATVVVRAELPVIPFPTGILAGARSPRQIAEKAKAHAKEAVPLFENGAVAKWYQQNGWIYPVQSPAASGLGVIQQFFEALGLTPPPKVEISVPAIELQGQVGDRVGYNLEVKTKERRPVYAHAKSDQPWLQVGRAQLTGRTATIPLAVAQVPDREGEILTAQVTVTANGNQRFVVPVTLEVGSYFRFGEPTGPRPVGSGGTEPRPLGSGRAGRSLTVAALNEAHPKKVEGRKRTWLHAVPAVVLASALLLVVLWDCVSPLPPLAKLGKGDGKAGMPPFTDPDIAVHFSPDNRRFGIQLVHEKDPNLVGEFKRLTFDKQGETNNTCLKVREADYLFGQPPGKWPRNEKKKSLGLVELAKGRKWQSVMDFPDDIRVTQTIEILPNEQNWRYDTCLIHYLVENRSAKPHPVGIRFLLDTFIGAKDGVPFAIPGEPGLVQTQGDYKQEEIPDYVQALEGSELIDPGTIAQLGLKLPAFKLNDDDPELEPIARMVICQFPGQWARWDWDFKPINQDVKDSCVVLYWAEQEMQPGAKRAMAFTYGLGQITSSGSGEIGLTVGSSSIRPGKEFTVTAYIKSPEPGQKVKINLPKTGGFSFADGQEEEQTVEKGTDYSQVSWRVKAGEVGSYRVEVTSGPASEHIDVKVRPAGAF